jgi:ABC-type Fe3+-hydroxamate transport system substrate-binding protein
LSAMRIVSLCPSLTELVFDLGAGHELVGITKFCVHPVNRVENVEKIGGTKDPQLDRIIELAPDVVLFNEEENRKQDYDALLEAGLHLCNSFPKDSAETADMVRLIGAELVRVEAAEEIALDIEARSQRVIAESAGKLPVRFAYLIWRKPWMSVNGDTFASALLTQAGAVNIFADSEDRYPSFELEDLHRAQPELVLLCTEPFVFKSKHIDELVASIGLDPKRILIADGEYLSWYGSRTPAGIDYAEELVESARRLQGEQSQ